MYKNPINVYLFYTFTLIFTRLSKNAVEGELIVPGLLVRPYPFSFVSERDINLGLLANIHVLDGNGKCSIISPSGMLGSLSMRLAVEHINERNDILPNVTLGYVQMDTCSDPLKALEVSVYFVKDKKNTTLTNCRDCVFNSSYDSRFQSYDVIGPIGPSNSAQSVVVSPFMGTFRIPVMAISATANSLSDKMIYPYFLRLMPNEHGFLNMLLKVRQVNVYGKPS